MKIDNTVHYTRSPEAGQKKLERNTEEFIKKAKLVHGKLYSYQSAEYQTTHKKILIK